MNDIYFGTINQIPYENNDISIYAQKFFGCNVNFITTNVVLDGDCLMLVSGFFVFDSIKIPFKYEITHYQKNASYSLTIDMYLAVIYLDPDKNGYQINVGGNNVFLDKTHEYLTEFQRWIPVDNQSELSDVLADLYFYPHIDKFNGKTLRVTYDLITKTASFFITHYQDTNKDFDGRMLFYYDGSNFSAQDCGFNVVQRKNDDSVKSLWGKFFSKIKRNDNYNELMTGDYHSMTEVLETYEDAKKIAEIQAY